MKKLSLIILFALAVSVSAQDRPIKNLVLQGTFKVQPTKVIPALDIDWSVAQTFSKTLAANSTFTFSNVTDGRTVVIAVTNTASNFTLAWPSVKWTGNVAPVQTIGSKTDIYTCVKIGTPIYCSVVQNFTP